MCMVACMFAHSIHNRACYKNSLHCYRCIILLHYYCKYIMNDISCTYCPNAVKVLYVGLKFNDRILMYLTICPSIKIFPSITLHLEYFLICDRISHNQASTHTKSNLRFYQKWIASLIHYHIPNCSSFRTGKSGFCSSFLPTLSKPRVGDWCHYMAMAL